MRTPDCKCIKPLFASSDEKFLLIGSVAYVEICYTEDRCATEPFGSDEFKSKKVRIPLMYCPACGKRYLEEVK